MLDLVGTDKMDADWGEDVLRKDSCCFDFESSFFPHVFWQGLIQKNSPKNLHVLNKNMIFQ